ncbi:DUF3857 domain-containing protein [Aggregatimonas sangjinii]|uniref:DUF3857 domain-containing protein n=1 Tax=Aggregatimonas sangjinii TaxID=2583587 RepID=A0A5B7SLU0_9FLAO|nr:DUF3857 domain-containing protein [Aggregatimonas sangjinii]QCW99021.1 DUF3857 domain-containing protein [Aggregatimonas sangjinii]
MKSIVNYPIYLAVLLLVQFSSAQTVEFGELSMEELTEKEYPFDKQATAAILYSKRDTYYYSNNGGSQLVTKIHKRIKIYSKEGFEHATEYINLFASRSDQEVVRKLKAITYNLVNGEIVQSTLDKDQIFESELSYNYNQTRFTMPNVKPGSIIEFKYQIVSPFIWNIDEYRFQADIPIKRIEAQLRTPEGFNFRQNHKGYLIITPKVETKRDSRINMNVVVRSFELKNVPALKEEPFVDNIDNYRSGAQFELASINIPGVLYKSYAHTWGDVAKTIGSSDDFKNQLDKTRSFDDKLDNLLAGKTDQLEKAKGLFKHVKSTITWNGGDGKYFQNGIKKTLKEKRGNAGDINLLLVAMMRYAGIDANPVVISTKDNAIPFLPTLERLNYTIAYAKIDGMDYFMDATAEFSDLNLLPIKDYNWKGLLIDNEKMNWKQIDMVSPAKALNMYVMDINLQEDGSANGKYQSRFTNHGAYAFRLKYKDNNLDDFLVNRETEFDDIEISDYQIENVETYEGPVSESFNYLLENSAEVIGEKIYFRPMLFMREKENPFKKEIREYPVDFGYSFQEKYLINIAVPEGYSVESIPEDVKLAIPDGLGSFKYMIRQNAGQIQLSVIFDINKAMISAVNYPYLKECFKQVITKENEQIVLTKNSNEPTSSTAGGR